MTRALILIQFAARIAAALTTLDALDALPPGLKPTETV